MQIEEDASFNSPFEKFFNKACIFVIVSSKSCIDTSALKIKDMSQVVAIYDHFALIQLVTHKNLMQMFMDVSGETSDAHCLQEK